MKKFISLFIFLACYSSYSQSLSVFDVDTTSFPIMKAKFFAFDKDGKQIIPNAGDFSITENGQPRTVLNVTCTSQMPPTSISSVLVIDVSGSMKGSPLDMEKEIAKFWINMLPLGLNDCAITSFSDNNYINQDFTSNKNKLENAINSLKTDSLKTIEVTDYNAAMIDPAAGGILIAETGKHKRIIIFLTDGKPNFEPSTQEIIDKATINGITIYCLSINLPAHHTMKEFSKQNGGICFENIKSKDIAEELLRKIFAIAQNTDVCEIEWMSGSSCQSSFINLEVKLKTYNLIDNANYQLPYEYISSLEFRPLYVEFKYLTPNKQKDTTIKITVRNADLNITNISVSNKAFSITPTSLNLKKGVPQYFVISCIPPDSSYIHCEFTFENDLCPVKFYVTEGFPGKKGYIRTLKLIQPNGGEVFLAGSDTVITWEGIPPEESVIVEYRSADTQPWIKCTDTAKGLSYKFHVPKIASDKYLARVTEKVVYLDNTCKVGDVQICNQVWMGCNLDVDHYRNGDSIPEVKDFAQWSNLKTGAWCYYENNPDMEPIYGKLYNWFAVNDPRGLAPEGWHIPSEKEWEELDDCLGGVSVAGKKLKSTGNLDSGDGLWFYPNVGATNSSGFSGIPGGVRDYGKGYYYNMTYYGAWWTSTEFSYLSAWYRSLGYDNIYIYTQSYVKGTGFSVRCVRDK